MLRRCDLFFRRWQVTIQPPGYDRGGCPKQEHRSAAGKDACLVKIKPAAMMRPSAGAIHISLKAANNV